MPLKPTDFIQHINNMQRTLVSVVIGVPVYDLHSFKLRSASGFDVILAARQRRAESVQAFAPVVLANSWQQWVCAAGQVKVRLRRRQTHIRTSDEIVNSDTEWSNHHEN